MKNIFNKTNVPYLVSGALAIGTLLASGVFAVAPYVGFLAPVAALGVGLPFIIGGAVFSAITITLSAVVISKNNAISQQEKFSNLVAQRKQEEETARAELKAEGLLPDIIALPYKDTELFDKQEQSSKEEVNLNYLDLEVSPSRQGKQANGLDFLDLATSRNLNDLEDDLYFDAQSQDTEVSSIENQPTEEGTKVNGYFNQAVSAVNWLAGQATKVMPYLAASYLPYVFYNYATTPVSASFDDVNVTQPFVVNSGITNSIS